MNLAFDWAKLWRKNPQGQFVAEAVSAGFAVGFAAASTLQSLGNLPFLSGLHRSLDFLAAGATGFTTFLLVVEATFAAVFVADFLASATVAFFFVVETIFFFTIFFLASLESSSFRLKMLLVLVFLSRDFDERRLAASSAFLDVLLPNQKNPSASASSIWASWRAPVQDKALAACGLFPDGNGGQQ